MAQQAAYRLRRGAGKKNPLFRGILISVGFTVAAVIIFALIISFASVPDGVIRIVNQLIKIAAIFLGVRAATGRGDGDALRKGALLGLIYMGVGVLIYSLLSGQRMDWLGYVIDLLMGVAVGGLSGMILGSMGRK